MVVSPKYNEWGTNYWLSRCIQGKKTLNEYLTDCEGIEFPIVSMVVNGEYITLYIKLRKTSGYIFMDY